MKVNIYNQCSDFKLTFRGYFGNGTNGDENPDEDVDTGSMKCVDLTPYLVAFEGAIMHKLETKPVINLSQQIFIFSLLGDQKVIKSFACLYI
jgi:hypothetical protein